MIRDILGILADIVGLVFVWWQPENLSLFWKLVISILLAVAAIVIFLVSRNRPVAHVTDYSWENNNDVILFAKKNTYYDTNRLVSIYMKEQNTVALCAIGFVKMDPVNKQLHIQVLHQINSASMKKIKSTSKQYKQYFMLPYITQTENFTYNSIVSR